MTHPYRSAPDKAFWRRAVSDGFAPRDLFTRTTPLIGAGERIMSAGSCFAGNLAPYLENAGFDYVRTERRPEHFLNALPEAMNYDRYSAAYGNIYTARQLLQLLRRTTGAFTPAEDRWIADGAVIDAFRAGLRFPARSAHEFEALTAQHLRAVRQAFETANVFIFTLGLTEAWVSAADGAVFPACPGTIAGTFDPSRHQLANFSVQEVADDLIAFVDEVRTLNPSLRVILTVSPVPLVATATDQHVLVASTYSKAVLRVAAQIAADQRSDVAYFPAYEIVTGSQAPESFFEADRRSVSRAAVDVVMDAFLSACERGGGVGEGAKPTGADLSALIVSAECEEAGQEL